MSRIILRYASTMLVVLMVSSCGTTMSAVRLPSSPSEFSFPSPPQLEQGFFALRIENQNLICAYPTDLRQVLNYFLSLREITQQRESAWQSYRQNVEAAWKQRFPESN